MPKSTWKAVAVPATIAARPPDCATPYIEELRQRFGPLPQLLRIESTNSSTTERRPYAVEEGVAIININGVLSNDPWWWDETGYGQIKEEVAQALDDNEVRALLLSINSPGGETTGAFELATFLGEARRKKVMWAVANPIAYSAAYLMASQASKIYVPPVTGGVGSIGVFTMHADMSKALEKMGIDVTLLSAGDGKTDGNPYEPLSKTAKANLQDEIDRLYSAFTTAVATGRGISDGDVRALGAYLYRGKTAAIGSGLADAVGTLEDAWVELATATAPKQQSSSSSISNASKMIVKDNIIRNSLNASIEEDVATASAADHEQPATTTITEQELPMSTTNTNATPTADATQTTSPPVVPVKQFTQADMDAAVAAAVAKLQPAQAQTTATVETPVDTAKAAADPHEVIALCGIAGKPQAAIAFITAKTPLAQVRKSLMERTVAEDNAGDIESHVDTRQPHTTNGSQGTNGKQVTGDGIIARCKKLAAEMTANRGGAR